MNKGSFESACTRIRQRIQTLRQSRFARNFLALASANLLAQVLPFMAAPVMTRLYAPSDYGGVTLFTSAVGILVAFATFRLDWIVASSVGLRRARIFMLTGSVLTIAVCLVLGVASPFFGTVVAQTFDGPASNQLPWLLPLAVLLSSSNLLLVAWCVRSAKLSSVGHGRILAAILGTATGLVCGVLGLGLIGLLAMTFISWIVPLFVILRSSRTAIVQAFRPAVLSTAWRVMGRNRSRISYSGLTGIVNVLGLFLPMILISAHYSSTEAGWYALMHRLATVPLTTIATAMGQSFWAEANQLHKVAPTRLRALFNTALRNLTLLAVVSLVICLLGPLYVGPLFGRASWGGAGWVLAALGPFFATQIIVSPLAPLITVLRHERWIFFWDVGRTLAVISVFYVAKLVGLGFLPAVLGFSTVMAAAYLIALVKIRRLVAELGTTSQGR